MLGPHVLENSQRVKLCAKQLQTVWYISHVTFSVGTNSGMLVLNEVGVKQCGMHMI
jgi:hypothetical protein